MSSRLWRKWNELNPEFRMLFDKHSTNSNRLSIFPLCSTLLYPSLLTICISAPIHIYMPSHPPLFLSFPIPHLFLLLNSPSPSSSRSRAHYLPLVRPSLLTTPPSLHNINFSLAWIDLLGARSDMPRQAHNKGMAADCPGSPPKGQPTLLIYSDHFRIESA